MSVVLNPYSQHQAQLGTLENGLRSLKTSKDLMGNNAFADMYAAIEKHHHDLKLAHLTGKSKDLMEQAEKDTKFYNILVKMLCEVKKLPGKDRKESLKKVHTWYCGNRHTLQTGPRFGKVSLKMESRDGKASMTTSRTNSANQSTKSANQNKGDKLGKKSAGKNQGDFRKFVSEHRDERLGNESREDISSPHGIMEGFNVPSEPGSSRLSMFGTDFMTSRFLSDLPAAGGSKLSWTADLMTPTTEWEGPENELQRIAESSLGVPDFPSRLSAHFSPGDHDDIDSDAGSVLSDNSGAGSSPAEYGSEMMDISEVRRRLSRPQTSSGSLRNGMTEDASSSTDFGLPRRMVHSIASLVNPHAKLAETEAKKAEQEYYRQQESFRVRMAQSAGKIQVPSSGKTDRTSNAISEHTVVLRPVTVTGTHIDNIHSWKSFSKDHVYGQDILSKLTFVGRSGTALDVRYSAHDQGEMPERHTKHVIDLFKQYSEDGTGKENTVATENTLHNQTLEEFYQTADRIFTPQLPKYSRTQSAVPLSRGKSAKTAQSAKTATSDRKTSNVRFQRTEQQKSKDVQKKGVESAGKSRDKGGNPDDIRLDTVVNMIDMVKDEMNFFREKLAPTPMPGFKQPASAGVPTKPLSRPATGRSRTSPSPVRRSPSPVQRANTPTQEPSTLMMGEPEVPLDTMKPTPLPARPHSATVSRAVDWRGKISPDTAKNNKWSKTRFGGHTYVQKSKPSFRTAGRVTGKRPKTAPVSTRERWKTDKEPKPIKLPDVKTHKIPTKEPPPLYPVKVPIGTVPSIVVESDKNVRIPQAASNTVKEVDQKDVDALMTVNHILGSSDSRYGSYGSLLLDEDFLKSINTRYTPTSSTGVAQPKEYVSIIGSVPRAPGAADSRTQSRQNSVKRPDGTIIDRIPEEASGRGDEEEAVPDAYEADEEQIQEQAAQQQAFQQQLQERLEQQYHLDQQQTLHIDSSQQAQQGSPVTEPKDKPNVPPLHLEPQVPTLPVKSAEPRTIPLEQPDLSDRVLIHQDLTEEERPVETTKEEEVPVQTFSEEEKIPQRQVQVHTEDHDNDVHIEVTSVPAAGRPVTPPAEGEKAIAGLSKSDAWHYVPDAEIQPVDSQEYIKSVRREELRSAKSDSFQYSHDHWSHTVVKPENYCFECMPEGMSTKVGRSAGRMPGRSQSPSGQVLRMARRQNEYFKKAPPVRTPPSIPSPHHPLGGRSPRTGQVYSTELEHHARKVKSPRHFMEQVVELRKDSCRSAPPVSDRSEQGDMLMSLNVISLRVPDRAQTAPSNRVHQTHAESFTVLQPFPEEDQEELETKGVKKVLIKQTLSPPNTATSQSIAHIGRPIPQVSQIPDPDAVAEQVQKQREAKAAVDIQRIFRGYVARNVYNKLLWEERQKSEDKQLEQVEMQKSFRRHLDRKAKIYKRPPISAEALKWAKEFKEVQTLNAEKRQDKMDSLQREMSTNQLKAASKISVIGPHVEIYNIYHPKQIGPTKKEMHDAAVMIQTHVRGFLVRKRFEKLKRKAVFCGTTWKKMVREYKNQLVRIQQWWGVKKPSTPFTLKEMHEYMDTRRRYESVFDKKSFSGELELNELDSFFRECDLYPSAAEIEHGVDVILQGHSLKKGQGLQKSQVLNLLYYIYVPSATRLQNTRQSTWMNPIIDGVEAKKLLGSEFIEAAPLSKCADLVINSRRERREKEQEERAKQLQKEAEADSDDDEEVKLKKSRRGSQRASIVKKHGKAAR